MDRGLAFGSATLAASAAYYWMAAAIPKSQLADAIGPQGLPRTYAVLLAALSLVLISRSIMDRVGRGFTPRQAGRKGPPYGSWRVAGMLAIGVIYIMVAPWLGYLLSIAALILATTYYQGGRVNRRVAVVALAGGIFFWLLFVVMMGIAQPRGWWPP